MRKYHLYYTSTADASVEEIASKHWRLSIPAGLAGEYRLAQFDDYRDLKRSEFPLRPPITIRLQARCSAPDLPGTWGFGLWNDPFSLKLGLGGGARKFPTLPQAAWFFFASPPNYLSFRDDLPAVGALAATFSSRKISPLLRGLGAPFLPALAFRPIARLFRKLARLFIKQSAVLLKHDPTQWQNYEILWLDDKVVFSHDGQIALESVISPKGPLGLVVWIDNQYASLPSDGKLGWGSLENGANWIEVKDLEISNEG